MDDGNERRRVELDFPPRPEYLALVRSVITMVAQTAADLPNSRIDDLRLTVTEAVANAIDAERRRADGQHHIAVSCWVEDDQMHIEVHDQGGGFDPDELEPHPPVTHARRLDYERGLGIPLMRALADRVEFRAERGGTTVSLVLTAKRPA